MRLALITDTDPNSPSTPIGADEFSALMQKFQSSSRLAVAVSGGPDSMALACCLKRWAHSHSASLLALIVDHGLRPESAVEAAETQRRLEVIGMATEILCWEHGPVTTRLHITARRARYRLLSEACHRHGIHDLALAHHQEDQAETILMRLAKGSGVDGLAGMGAETSINRVRLLRPLLSLSKDRLIATCQEAGIRFIEDGSNSSEKFARGRLRKVMPHLAEEGLTVERLTELGARAAVARDALEHYTHTFLREATKRDIAGVIRIEAESFCGLPREIAGRALAACLQDVHPEDYAPEYASLMRMVDILRGGEMPSRTLHGCLVSRTSAHITITREFAGIMEITALQAGEPIVWDKRWRVMLDKTARDNFVIQPLGLQPHEVLDALTPELRRLIPQGRARAALPAFWNDGKLLGIASLTDSGMVRAQLVSAWPPR